MPIYAYRCTSCGVQKDHLQKISDPVMTVCPECGQPTYQKMLSAPQFQLKGSGWYATDFKGGSTTAPAPSDGAKAAQGKDGAKDGASKDNSSKESGSKEGGAKESGSKESGSKESGSKDSASSTPSTPAPSGSA